MTEGKALQPLTNGGTVLIVGVKSSNLDDEIRTHPRVTLWDSQNENWQGKSVPDNTRVIFMTRFISHRTSEMLLSEARKKQLTIFNPEGTGIIAKQVRELLAITPKTDAVRPKEGYGKLNVLIPFIDFSLSSREGARALMVKAVEVGISTTENSLASLITKQRKDQHRSAVPKSIRGKLDVSVEILDSMIQSLKDMRDFLIATVDENKSLREKVERFKKVLSE